MYSLPWRYRQGYRTDHRESPAELSAAAEWGVCALHRRHCSSEEAPICAAGPEVRHWEADPSPEPVRKQAAQLRHSKRPLAWKSLDCGTAPMQMEWRTRPEVEAEKMRLG